MSSMPVKYTIKVPRTTKQARAFASFLFPRVEGGPYEGVLGAQQEQEEISYDHQPVCVLRQTNALPVFCRHL